VIVQKIKKIQLKIKKMLKISGQEASNHFIE